MQTLGAVLALLMWPIYFGQIVSVVNLPLARRLGLQETPDTIDPIYARDTAGTARWDVLSMWTLPVAGILMLIDSAWWPYLALIGGTVYLDTGGRQVIKLLGYRREGVRVGTKPGGATGARGLCGIRDPGVDRDRHRADRDRPDLTPAHAASLWAVLPFRSPAGT